MGRCEFPLGYLNIRNANNKDIMVRNPRTRPSYQDYYFEDFAKGYSISGDL